MANETFADAIAQLSTTKTAIFAALAALGVPTPETPKLDQVPDLLNLLLSENIETHARAWSIDRRTMTSLTVPEGVVALGDSAFYNCPEMVALSLPSTLRRIGPIAFYNCQKLATLHIPDGVVELGGGAFNACYGLTSLRLPKSIERLGSAVVFGGCPVSCDIIFERPMAEVSALEFHPWGFKKGAVIHCSDGDLTVE